MSKPMSQLHLAVYKSLMDWRRVMYVESNDKAKVMGVAGEAWNWAALTEGDLKFIAVEVAKLEQAFNIKVELANSPKVAKIIKDKLDKEDLLEE